MGFWAGNIELIFKVRVGLILKALMKPADCVAMNLYTSPVNQLNFTCVTSSLWAWFKVKARLVGWGIDIYLWVGGSETF